METGMAVNLMNGGIVQILLLSAPILVVGVVVGLIISIFQATTSIQDQTISFVPKILAIFGTLFLFGPWIFGNLQQYTVRIFEMIPQMVR